MRRLDGFTLIEAMLALVILALVILGLTTATATFIHVVAVGQTRAEAIQLAEARIDRIQMDPSYGTLEAYATTESSIPNMPGYARLTEVVRVQGSDLTMDHKVITVTVTHNTLPDTVMRTVTVAAP